MAKKVIAGFKSGPKVRLSKVIVPVFSQKSNNYTFTERITSAATPSEVAKYIKENFTSTHE